MKHIFWILFFSVTVAGGVLVFLPHGAWPWWDSIWTFVFFVAVYADLAGATGLAGARLASGVVVIAMAIVLGLTALTGWPCGPLQFTARAGLHLGGALPLTLPLLAFSLLTVSGRAADAVFPAAGRNFLAAATAAGFLITVVNALAFFVTDRGWWEWNSSHDPNAGVRAVFALAFLAALAFALAFVYPIDSRMKRHRWNAGAAAWMAANALFLLANFSKK